MKRHKGISRRLQAFTLIELLVVIAIIALLLSIIIPSLRLVKQKAASIVCLTNVKNLALAWYSYAEDHDSYIMSSWMDGRDNNGKFVSWIGRPVTITNGTLSDTQIDPPVTDADEIRGLEKGLLYPYVDTPDAYNCPADKVKSKYDGTEKFVTYAIPQCLYGFPNNTDAYYAQYYAFQIRKYSEMASPSMRYNFVESAEQRNWIRSGHFVFGAPEYTGDTTRWGWWGPMAVNHGSSSVLGFCDGHAEVHQWRDSYTKERVEKLTHWNTDTYDIDFPPAGQTSDIDYMARGWAYRYK